MAKITSFEQRQKFRFLCNQIYNGCSIDYIVNQLSGKRGVMPFSKFSCITIENETIYRARINQDNRLFSYVNELSYPPNTTNIRKGRCNRDNESILYASTSELGTIVEHVSNGMNLDTLFTIAHIKKKENQGKLFFKEVGIENSQITLDKYSKEFHEFCNKEFLKVVDKKNPSPCDYNFTIALSNHYLNTGVKTINPSTGKKEDSNFDMALVYPSVHSKITTNKTVYNLAIKPDVFDSHYEIYEAFSCLLIHEKPEDYIMLTPLNRAIAKNSELFWDYTYSEMIERAKNGMGFGDIKSEYVKNFLKKIF